MRFIKVCPSTGYWQVELEPCNKEKTEFLFSKGHFKFNVMPFGLLILLQYLSILMECTLAGLVGGQCLIYLDDVIIFSSTFFSNHLIHCASIFDILRTVGLKFKLTYVFHTGTSCVSWSYYLQQKNHARQS